MKKSSNFFVYFPDFSGKMTVGGKNCIAFKEGFAVISLDTFVVQCGKKPFYSIKAVFLILFYSAEFPVEFSCRHQCGTGTGKRIKDHIPFPGTGKDQFCHKFFRFLGGVKGIFRH